MMNDWVFKFSHLRLRNYEHVRAGVHWKCFNLKIFAFEIIFPQQTMQMHKTLKPSVAYKDLKMENVQKENALKWFFLMN